MQFLKYWSTVQSLNLMHLLPTADIPDPDTAPCLAISPGLDGVTPSLRSC